MNESQIPTEDQPLDRRLRVDRASDEFERQFKSGEKPRIEKFLSQADPADHKLLLRELLRVELELRRAGGDAIQPSDYQARFSAHGEILESLLYPTVAGGDTSQPPLAVTAISNALQAECPEFIGPYEIIRLLGRGGFAEVYLGRHPQEKNIWRAIKTPRRDRSPSPAELAEFVREAQTAAQLSHPHIVTVHDVRQTEACVYIALDFIDGETLAERLKATTLSPEQAVELLIPIADAIGHAHHRKFYHRDLKPANILLDARGKPYVADFGLALHENAQRGRSGELAGTYPYMSPEQARGETHRLDGRSDLWSLGVIFYEMLTGRRPFAGETLEELLDEIERRDPKPPRQIDPSIPAEISRICLVCLSKRSSDRYPSAADLIDDLHSWRKAGGPATAPQESSASTPAPPAPARIVPKGLASFDEHDADFFLELLPGPHDRDGLPKSIRFWKTRLEQRDPDKTFQVGLIYGPSGCGKSSLVKAGLIPRLSRDLLPIYIEATPADTEVRLIKALRKQCPHFSADASLPELIAQLRSHGGAQGRKVVLILDQFEQWLHAHPEPAATQLVLALRQCDGAGVQAVTMVRDDFWMSATHFMQALEAPLLEEHNSLAVHLFDPSHAQKVLAAFGVAYGKLPAAPGEPSPAQVRFLEQAVAGLASEGKVVSVRLAVFADMLRGRVWDEASLAAVGGAEGVGVAFLEETFGSKNSLPLYRLHQPAIRAILKTLLPEQGTEIKGQMQSYEQLQAAAGYGGRIKEFDELLRVLSGQLRLITPTEPDQNQALEASQKATQGGFYQLTHDYLVPSLREWLTRKQKETAKGRAELLLADRAAVWKARPENQQLPSLLEWGRILWLTDRQHRTASEKTMLRQARRYHLVRGAAACAAAVVLLVAGLWVRGRVAEQQEATRVEGLVGRLVSAEPNQLPEIVRELDATPQLADRFLSPLLAAKEATPETKRAQLHARLARVSRDPALVDQLAEELLTGQLAYVLPLRRQLRPFAVELREKYGKLLRDEQAGPEQRFRAALALAEYVPDAEAKFWSEADLSFVAGQLVSANAEFQPLLREALRPIRSKLLGELKKIFSAREATDAKRLSAANAFADYAGGDVGRLSELLTVATPEQHAVLFPLVKGSPSPATVEKLAAIAAMLPPEKLGAVERIPFGQRRANAAVTLLQLGEREKVLPVFNLTDDPEALTQFIFRCRPRGVGAEPLLDCLQRVSAAPQDRYPQHGRYALLLALGEFKLEEIPEARRETAEKQLGEWYRDDPSSGVHGAAGWLLRQWGQAEIARQVDQTPVAYSPEREWFTLAISVKPTPPEGGDDAGGAESTKPPEPPPSQTFYYTFIVFPAGDYAIGSPPDEPDRLNNEDRHPVRFSHPFAILDREVTFEELIAFIPQYTYFMQQYDAQPADAGFGVDWYDSVGFCRWLGEQSGLREADQAYASPESLDQDKYPREPNSKANWAPQDWPVELGRRGFRLPTEAEWEVASRGAMRSSYGSVGDVGLLGRFGWLRENSGKHVHPPRKLRPSMHGLFDLHGNLYEWTHDWFGDFDSTRTTDPLVSEGGSVRVSRGGCWNDVAGSCRSAFRATRSPTSRSSFIGFRLALSPSGVTSPAEQEQEQEPGAKPGGGGTEGARAEPRPELP